MRVRLILSPALNGKSGLLRRELLPVSSIRLVPETGQASPSWSPHHFANALPRAQPRTHPGGRDDTFPGEPAFFPGSWHVPSLRPQPLLRPPGPKNTDVKVPWAPGNAEVTPGSSSFEPEPQRTVLSCAPTIVPAGATPALQPPSQESEDQGGGLHHQTLWSRVASRKQRLAPLLGSATLGRPFAHLEGVRPHPWIAWPSAGW